MQRHGRSASWGSRHGGGSDARAAAEEVLEEFERSLGMREDRSHEPVPGWHDEPLHSGHANSALSNPGTEAGVGYNEAERRRSRPRDGASVDTQVRRDSVRPECGEFAAREPDGRSPAGRRRNELKYDDRPADDPDGEFVCAYCGRRYDTGMNPGMNGTGFFTSTSKTYCSKRCKNDAAIRRRSRKPKERKLATCPICGELFEARRKNMTYCSAACKQKAYRQRKNEQNSSPSFRCE